MTRKVAAWLSEKPWGAAFAGAALGVLAPQGLLPLAVLGGSVPVLITLRRGELYGIAVAAVSAIAPIIVHASVGQSIGLSALYSGAVFVAPLALSVLLRRTGSLVLTFQLAIVAVSLAVCAVYAWVDNPAAIWESALREVAASLTQAGIDTDTEELVSSLASKMWGACAALWLLTMLGSLFLGRWWQSQLESPGAFGEEYRSLRLGKVLGVMAVVVGAGALWSDVQVIDALAWIAVAALAFQGLGAAHRRKAAGRMNRGWLAAIYVLLFMPTAFFMVSVLAGWGLADNWLRLKTRRI